MPQTILIVDNDTSQLHAKEHVLHEKLHYQTVKAANAQAALDAALSGKTPVDAVLLDLVTMKEEGFALLAALHGAKPNLPVIAFTAYGDDALAAQALRAGAHDYLTKPVAAERLKLSLQHAIRIRRLHDYVRWLERKVAGHVDFRDLVGESPEFKKSLRHATAAAASPSPVWLEGAEGTGKELFARAIHGGSERAAKPFVAVHCETLPEHLAEAILFGQESSAAANQQFTLGKLRAADGGTLMLREAGSLPLPLQRRLFDAILSGSVTPVGGKQAAKIDVRLVAVSGRQGRAAADPLMLQKLKPIAITLPPLSERKEDVAILAGHFLTLYAASENKVIQSVTGRALQWLASSPWPGNVGQLAHVMWRAVLMCDKAQLDLDDFQAVQKAKPNFLDEAPRSLAAATAASMLDEKGQVRTLKSIEEDAIRMALHSANGCMARAARSLGIGRSTLYRKVGELEAKAV